MGICLLGVSGYLVYDKVFEDKKVKVDMVHDTNNNDKQESSSNDNKTNDNVENDGTNNNIDNNQSDEEIFSSNLNVMSRTEYFNNKRITEDELNNSLDKGNSDAIIVKNEIKTLLAYMSGAIQFNFDGDNIDITRLLPSCFYLNIGLDITGYHSSNLLDGIAPNILECMYGFKYQYVEDNPYNGSYLMTNEDYLKMKNYFVKVPSFSLNDAFMLNSYDEFWKNRVEDEFYNEAKKYLNKGYRYAYGVGDGFGENEIFLENAGIIKKDNKYEVSINVYDYAEKTGTSVLEVEVVDGHLKYGSLELAKMS